MNAASHPTASLTAVTITPSPFCHLLPHCPGLLTYVLTLNPKPRVFMSFLSSLLLSPLEPSLLGSRLFYLSLSLAPPSALPAVCMDRLSTCPPMLTLKCCVLSHLGHYQCLGLSHSLRKSAHFPPLCIQSSSYCTSRLPVSVSPL